MSAVETNWCQTRRIARPDRIVAVSPAKAPGALAALDGERVQFLGARYTYPDLIDGRDGYAVVLRTPEPRVRDSGPDAVTAAGDATLSELWEHLRARGRTLPVCPPVITDQTVAGALGTGTHAQGLRQGLISDAVTAVTYLDPAGSRHHLDASHPDFGAFLLHLGSLGLITEVTFAVCANTRYRCRKSTVGYDDLLDHYASWNHDDDHCKAWWFVDDQRAHVWRVRRADGERGPSTEGPNHELNPLLAATQQRLGDDTQLHDRGAAAQRTLGRFYDYVDTEGDLVDIFRNGIPAPQINMEVGVPLDRFQAAAEDLDALLKRSAYRLHYPVILRATGPSEAWLAPSYGRSTCYFGFVVYQGVDGGVAQGSRELLGEIQRTLATHEGLPHWGKYFDPAAFDFTRLPRWSDFLRVRRARDPGRRLLGRQLDRILAA